MRCKINRGGEGKPLVDTKTCDSINFFYILSPSFSYIIFANSVFLIGIWWYRIKLEYSKRRVILNGSRIDKNGFGKKNIDVIKLQIIAGKSVSLSVSKTARLISRN